MAVMTPKHSVLPGEARQDVRSFEYPETFSVAGAPVGLPGSGPAGANTALGERERREHEQQVWEQGVAEGEARARTFHENALQQERDALGQVLREFARTKAEYFHQVEGETVQLALSIARKILHREVQLDPLMLAGVVRVALDKITSVTSITLRVSPGNVRPWKRYFEKQPGLAVEPHVVGDAELEGARVVLETSLGTTELGLEEQLKEIEKGFFDLLARTSGPAEAPVSGSVSASVPTRAEAHSPGPAMVEPSSQEEEEE